MRAGNQESIAKYRARAVGYDASARFTADLRARTIAHLGLVPGETVLDAGSGTGLSLPLLVEAVGPTGRVIGIEQSPEMMAQARARVAAAAWSNVTLVEAPVEAAVFTGPVDALLFNYAHDILQSAAALDRLFAAAVPGARVAVAGVKYHPWWLAPANLHVWWSMRRYNANLRGLRQPWKELARRVPDLQRESTLLGRGYIGWGRYRPGATQEA